MVLFIIQIKTTKMKKITQFEVISRIYEAKRIAWELENKTELTREYKISKNGVRLEFSVEDNVFKPFYTIRRFDPLVSIRSNIKHDIRFTNNLSVAKSVLNDNEYFLLRKEKITKN